MSIFSEAEETEVRRRMATHLRKKRVKALVLLAATSLVFLTGLYSWYYMAGPYVEETTLDAERAMALIDQAASTVDIDRSISLLKQAETKLAAYEGNYAWWLPTEGSSFDEAKSSLASTITWMENQRDGGFDSNSFAVQQQYANMVRSLGDLRERVQRAQGWVYWTPLIIAMLVASILAVFFGGAGTFMALDNASRRFRPDGGEWEMRRQVREEVEAEAMRRRRPL